MRLFVNRNEQELFLRKKKETLALSGIECCHITLVLTRAPKIEQDAIALSDDSRFACGVAYSAWLHGVKLYRL